MTTEQVQVSGLIPTTPEVLYDAWLDGVSHSRFTGTKATIEPHVGGKYSAWNGEAFGEFLELERGKRIVQSWRTKDFPEDAQDSRVEITLMPAAGGSTEIVFQHSGVPEDLIPYHESGWLDRYLGPMRAYFGALAAAAAKANKAPKPAAAKPAPASSGKSLAAAPRNAGKDPVRAKAPQKKAVAAKVSKSSGKSARKAVRSPAKKTPGRKAKPAAPSLQKGPSGQSKSR